MISAKTANKLALASVFLQSSGREIKRVPEGKQGRLVVKPHKCVGCGTCEMVCAFVHSTPHQLGRSRIHVHKMGEERYMQLTCLQCAEAACVKVCPTEALVRNAQNGAVEVNLDRCIGCRSCEVACPFGHMHFDRQNLIPIKCDLCGGAPACAAFCPYEALEVR